MLTKTFVESAEALPPAGKSKVLHWDEGKGAVTGFGLSVTANGVRSYVAQGRVDGQSRRITIGRHGVFTVQQARERAAEVLLGMRQGTDPRVTAVADAAQRVSLKEVLDDYIEKHRTSHGEPLRPESQREMTRHVVKLLADMADRPIANITRDACLEAHRKLSVTTPGSANQMIKTLRALINYAREKYAAPDGSYTIHEHNPVARAFGKHKLGRMNKVEARVDRVPLDKVGAVWRLLRQQREEALKQAERTAADYVSFLLLTGCRADESATLEWDRVNLAQGWFHLPASRVKNHNAVTLPLSAPLRELLAVRKAEAGGDAAAGYVFTGNGASGHLEECRATMRAITTLSGCKVTRHGLRRTFDDIAGACHVGDGQRRQLLNHLANDVHGQSYDNNPDPKVLAPAAERVAAWVLAQAAAEGNVVAMPRRA